MEVSLWSLGRSQDIRDQEEDCVIVLLGRFQVSLMTCFTNTYKQVHTEFKSVSPIMCTLINYIYLYKCANVRYSIKQTK